MASVEKRLYVGGLFDGIKESDLKERFQQFGEIESINIKGRKNEQGETVKTFAFIHMNTTEENLKKCTNIFSKSKWKGHRVTVQSAKEDFIARLQKERNSANNPDTIPEKKTKTNSELEQHLVDAGVKDFNKRGAVPGTGIPGERNWVVGKFGRVLPIVHVRRKDKKKIMKYDPSKHTHGLKRFQDGGNNDEHGDELTWELQERLDENYKKRKGEFKERKIKKGRQRKSSDGKDENDVKIGNHLSNYGNNSKDDNSYVVQEDSSDVEIVFTNIRQRKKTSESASKYGVKASTPIEASGDLPPKRISMIDVYDSDDFIDKDEDFFDRLDTDKTLRQKLESMSSSKSREKMQSSTTEDDDCVMEVVSEEFTPKSYLIYGKKQSPGTSPVKSDKSRTKSSKKDDVTKLGFCDDSVNDSTGSADTDDICTVTKTPTSFLVDADDNMSTSKKQKKKKKIDSIATVPKTPVKSLMNDEGKKSETKKNKKILVSMATPTVCEEQIKVKSKLDITVEKNKKSAKKGKMCVNESTSGTATKKSTKKRKSENLDVNKPKKSERMTDTLDSSRAMEDTSAILTNDEHKRNTDSGIQDSLVGSHTKIRDKTKQKASQLSQTLKGLTSTPAWADDVELPKQKPSIMDFYDSDDFVDEEDDLFDRLDVDKSLKQKLEVMSTLKKSEKKRTEDVVLEVVSEKYTPKYRLFRGSEGSDAQTVKSRTNTKVDIKKFGLYVDSGNDSTGSADTDDICTTADTPRMVLFDMDKVMSTSKKNQKKKQMDSVATDYSVQKTPMKAIKNDERKKSETKKKKVPTATLR